MKKLFPILNLNKDIYVQVNSFSIGTIGKSVIVYDKDLVPRPLIPDPWKLSSIFDKDIDFCKVFKGDVVVDVERDKDHYTINVLELDWFHDYYTECYIQSVDEQRFIELIEEGKDRSTFRKRDGGNY